MSTVTKLEVYQKSLQLAVRVYQISASFPVEERFGLSNQVRRAVGSVGANIAEGSKRMSVRERQRYHEIAIGSLEETKHHLRLACKLGYCTVQDLERVIILCESIGKMLTGLSKSLRPYPAADSRQP